MADELSGLDRLLDLEHVCAVLGGISRSKLYALARQNRLLLRKIDRLTRVRESDLVAFMATISEGRLESPNPRCRKPAVRRQAITRTPSAQPRTRLTTASHGADLPNEGTSRSGETTTQTGAAVAPGSPI